MNTEKQSEEITRLTPEQAKKEISEMNLINGFLFDSTMEDRSSDKKELPKRLRFYNALNDSKALDSGNNYNQLPNFVSVVIMSYDPFDAGDMYYEARSVLTTHPDITYENGVRNIFLYCNGASNFDDPDGKVYLPPEHSKLLKEMLKYIVSGEKPANTNSSIEEMDKIVTKVKGRKEVTIKYMRQWDRELSIKRDEKRKIALNDIRFDRENGISDEITRKRLKESYDYDNETIKELFEEIDSEVAVTN